MKPHQYCLLAALMAHSNMGLDRTEPSRIVKETILREDPWVLRLTARSASAMLSQAWMESDEIAETFFEEAEMWEQTLLKTGIVQTFKTWPWLADVISPRDLDPNYASMLEKEEARLCS